MAAITKDQILEAIGNMTVIEISELVKAMEEKFGVSAAPVAVAGAVAQGGGAAQGAAGAAEEKDEFDVILVNGGTVRGTGMSLSSKIARISYLSTQCSIASAGFMTRKPWRSSLYSMSILKTSSSSEPRPIGRITSASSSSSKFKVLTLK